VKRLLVCAAALALGSAGCDKIATFISKKADEKVAQEIDSAADELDDDSPPSGAPSKARKKKKSTKSTAEPTVADLPTPQIPKIPPIGQMPDPASSADGHVDYFVETATLPKLLKDKVGGPVEVVELVVYSDDVLTTIEDPKNPGTTNEFRVENGSVRTNAKGASFLPKKSPKDVTAGRFDIDTCDFAAVPAMVKDALKRLGASGQVTHVILERDLPFSPDVIFRVYTDGGRSAEYDQKGKWLKNF
jgi:hypothetical protein